MEHWLCSEQNTKILDPIARQSTATTMLADARGEEKWWEVFFL